ncbi:unnamed protein product [Vicia faba]|uniref:Uncharacterized protein n=1 Tax=Vicia faba TaxID=3906 RepID=A0AAV0YSK0_VICFA|nr:unnamed protein product [Vicia faba]
MKQRMMKVSEAAVSVMEMETRCRGFKIERVFRFYDSGLVSFFLHISHGFTSPDLYFLLQLSVVHSIGHDWRVAGGSMELSVVHSIGHDWRVAGGSMEVILIVVLLQV